MVSLDQDNLTVEGTRRPVNLVKVDIVGFQVLKSDPRNHLVILQMIGKNFSGNHLVSYIG